MPFSSVSGVVTRGLLVALSLVLIAGVIVVPWLLTLSSFATIAAVMLGSTWVLLATYKNGQPVSSLAQSLHDAENTAPRGRI